MSDSESSDSDSGFRYKTASTRKREEHPASSSTTSKRSYSTSAARTSLDKRDSYRDRQRDRSRDRDRNRDRNRDDRQQKSRRSRSKSKSRERKRRSRSKSKSRERKRKSQSHDRKKSPVKEAPVLNLSMSSLSSQEDLFNSKEEVLEDDAALFGPVLPPKLTKSEEQEDELVVGPALPSHLLKTEVTDEPKIVEKKIVGPQLPPNFEELKNQQTNESEDELSPFSEEECEEIVGPLLPGSSRRNLELEKRALELKIRNLDKADGRNESNATVREDWMIELPTIRTVTDLGLGARQFRTREKLEIGDRTVWTRTPNDKEVGPKPRDIEAEREEESLRRKLAERDAEQAEIARKHKKKHKREKSLVEIHEKKLKKEKKKKEKEEPAPSRRPFDRNMDLSANRFDEAQKKAIMKKAQLLDTRFSSGAAKFL